MLGKMCANTCVGYRYQNGGCTMNDILKRKTQGSLHTGPLHGRQEPSQPLPIMHTQAPQSRSTCTTLPYLWHSHGTWYCRAACIARARTTQASARQPMPPRTGYDSRLVQASSTCWCTTASGWNGAAHKAPPPPRGEQLAADQHTAKEPSPCDWPPVCVRSTPVRMLHLFQRRSALVHLPSCRL